MGILVRKLPREFLCGLEAAIDLSGKGFLHRFEILDLTVEMTGKQEGRVLQLSMAALDRALARVVDNEPGSGGNSRDQYGSEEQHPKNGPGLDQEPAALGGVEIGQSRTVIGVVDSCTCRHVLLPARRRNTRRLWSTGYEEGLVRD